MDTGKFLHKIYLVIFCIFLLGIDVYSQGCSDAGFCTMGAMKPDQQFNKKLPVKLRSLEVSFYRGTTSISPIIFVGTIDFAVGIGDKSGLQVKIPYQAVTGNFGNTSGLSDISLSFTRKIFDSEKWDINATLGTKIPTNKSDLKNNDTGVPRDYPMYYQVSLGSFDFIAGASLISREWLFAIGIQAALTKNNNHFRYSEWPDYPSQPYLFEYPLATELLRGTDIMVRVERNFRFSRFNVNIGFLPIYRIVPDEILDEDSGERVNPEDLDPNNTTTGLAASLLVGCGYMFNVNSGLKLLLGKKLTDRNYNPDGLTRENVLSLAYLYRF